MSALSLEKNGRVSSSKQSMHIKAKYFLMKDYYDAGEVDLNYCSTDTMWADVLTKPLQGQKFRDTRNFLQNYSRDYDDDLKQEEDERGQAGQSMLNHQVKTNASSWECVEEQQKTRHQPASRPRACSPTCSVAKLGITKSDFYAESEKTVPYKYTQNHPNRDQTISAVLYQYTQNHPNRDQNISAVS
jgi:hypothetical protein